MTTSRERWARYEAATELGNLRAKVDDEIQQLRIENDTMRKLLKVMQPLPDPRREVAVAARV